jgi:hypothetical protein
MPNHCSQDLWVTGPSETLKEFKEFAKESREYTDWQGNKAVDEVLLSANKFIPYPQKFNDMDKAAEEARAKNPKDWSIKDGFNSGGYEWCCDNWGTKWGIYACYIVRENLTKKQGSVMYSFDSAWSPACKIILAMSEKFPHLKFKLKYYEMGMGFKGTFVVKGGEILEDVNDKYSGHRGG